MSEHRPEQIRPEDFTVIPIREGRDFEVVHVERTAAAGKIDTSRIEREAPQLRTHRRDG